VPKTSSVQVGDAGCPGASALSLIRSGGHVEVVVDPAPERTCGTWAGFLRSQADAVLACNFFETVTLCGARMYVLAVIEHRTRRIRVMGATAHPTASWVAEAARNLVMDLADAGCRAPYLIRDRDGKFPELLDVVLTDAGIKVMLTGVRMRRRSHCRRPHCRSQLGTCSRLSAGPAAAPPAVRRHQRSARIQRLRRVEASRFAANSKAC
jgi:hypothetical protein